MEISQKNVIRWTFNLFTAVLTAYLIYLFVPQSSKKEVGSSDYSDVYGVFNIKAPDFLGSRKSYIKNFLVVCILGEELSFDESIINYYKAVSSDLAYIRSDISIYKLEKKENKTKFMSEYSKVTRSEKGFPLSRTVATQKVQRYPFLARYVEVKTEMFFFDVWVDVYYYGLKEGYPFTVHGKFSDEIWEKYSQEIRSAFQSIEFDIPTSPDVAW